MTPTPETDFGHELRRAFDGALGLALGLVDVRPYKTAATRREGRRGILRGRVLDGYFVGAPHTLDLLQRGRPMTPPEETDDDVTDACRHADAYVFYGHGDDEVVMTWSVNAAWETPWEHLAGWGPPPPPMPPTITLRIDHEDTLLFTATYVVHPSFRDIRAALAAATLPAKTNQAAARAPIKTSATERNRYVAPELEAAAGHTTNGRRRAYDALWRAVRVLPQTLELAV